ncbi:hypothetical protein BDY17DRAFT_318821 [Neohortaea acidophila]|uniref:Secretory lipase-domain-containing protein n=1 Tax=Neohortaea acidophila TaxID=245834 RepID=A0A6A6PIP8_9PEZI|nr:uncharacterized protein BDY17DRAFT_318821 [Neohortaea acidophila]KAF2479403.1 hypothetical protein BDY17DRAFT_318821 [Neohortaea acidophila]
MLTSLLSLALAAGLVDARAVKSSGTGNAPPLATSFPTPSEDPFYTIPANISKYANGAVVRARTVETTEFQAAINARQVLYRTTNRAGKATGTVTTVYIPPVPASPPQILSLQSFEDALNIRCAPSWANVNSSSTQEEYLASYLDPIGGFALANGYYFINSDDEDEDSEWLVGITEGRATLDGVRAAINDLNLWSPKVALIGYSGGAHESVWAASLAAAYAPELDIVGAAFGGTPIDPKLGYELLNGSPDAALAGGALVGYANGYPKLNRTLNKILTAKGKQVFAEFRGADACIVESAAAFAGVNFSSPEYFKSNPLDNKEVQHVQKIESLLENVSPLPIPVPKFPRFEWHGLNDTTVPYAPEAEYIQQQCAKGADIVFVSYPGLDHTEAAVIGLPGALLFVQEAFKGTLTKTKCAKSTSIHHPPPFTVQRRHQHQHQQQYKA